MSPVIRVDDDVWEWLKTQAQPLEDTPNSVMRRVAGIDPPLDKRGGSPRRVSRPGLASPHEVPDEDAAEFNAQMPAEPQQKRVTGEWLNKAFKLEARHALYHRDGTLFERLNRFPAVLCDRNGFVRFATEEEFESDPLVSVGEKVNLPHGLREHPRYERFRSMSKRRGQSG